jgi:hypothetical protein
MKVETEDQLERQSTLGKYTKQSRERLNTDTKQVLVGGYIRIESLSYDDSDWWKCYQYLNCMPLTGIFTPHDCYFTTDLITFFFVHFLEHADVHKICKTQVPMATFTLAFI